MRKRSPHHRKKVPTEACLKQGDVPWRWCYTRAQGDAMWVSNGGQTQRGRRELKELNKAEKQRVSSLGQVTSLTETGRAHTFLLHFHAFIHNSTFFFYSFHFFSIVFSIPQTNKAMRKKEDWGSGRSSVAPELQCNEKLLHHLLFTVCEGVLLPFLHVLTFRGRQEIWQPWCEWRVKAATFASDVWNLWRHVTNVDVFDERVFSSAMLGLLRRRSGSPHSEALKKEKLLHLCHCTKKLLFLKQYNKKTITTWV